MMIEGRDPSFFCLERQHHRPPRLMRVIKLKVIIQLAIHDLRACPPCLFFLDVSHAAVAAALSPPPFMFRLCCTLIVHQLTLIYSDDQGDWKFVFLRRTGNPPKMRPIPDRQCSGDPKNTLRYNEKETSRNIERLSRGPNYITRKCVSSLCRDGVWWRLG